MSKKSIAIFITAGVIIAAVIVYFNSSLHGKKARQDYIARIEQHRAEINDFFKNSEQSPLTDEQKAVFHGLSYFPIDPEYRVSAKFIKNPREQVVTINITDGSLREYYVYGWAEFTLDGKDLRLTVFKPVKKDSEYFFIPFYDDTSAETTYGGGRYVEPESIDGKKIIIDFNLAYNPYCAFNHRYRCPIPPRENNLKVPILAGEKIPGFMHPDSR